MNKNVLSEELCSRVKKRVKENGYRKDAGGVHTYFYITDQEGNSRRFDVRGRGNKSYLTISDVKAVIDALAEVIADALKDGDSVSIPSIGKFSAKLTDRRLHVLPNGEEVISAVHPLIKFKISGVLKESAKFLHLLLMEEGFDLENLDREEVLDQINERFPKKNIKREEVEPDEDEPEKDRRRKKTKGYTMRFVDDYEEEEDNFEDGENDG